jgi:HK97 gp10 family phage protein
MADDVTVQMSGLEDLEKVLEELAPKAALEAVRRAAREAGEIWEHAIEATAPVLTGALKDNIEITSRAKGNTLSVHVGPSKAIEKPVKAWGGQPADYPAYIEFGTKHQPATPFVGPAFESTKQDVLDKFVQELGTELKQLEEK